MKRLTLILTALLLSTFMLVACSDDKDEAKESDNNVVNEENNDGKDNGDVEKDDDDKKEDDTDSGNGTSEITTEDQLDLELGDTGKFDTTLGTYEMTVESAELLEELDGVESEFDYLILINLSIKNTSDHDLDVEDLMYSMEVTDNIKGSGHPDQAHNFESVKELTGIIKPGEEVSGQFITHAYESDEYYFRKKEGNVAGGSSNQVIWTIPADEAK